MKGFNAKTIDRIETLVGEGTVIEGDIVGENSILINGTVTGDVTTQRTIRVGRSGVIKGNVKAHSAKLGGIIEGNLDVIDSTVLGAHSRLKGDLKTARLKIEEGAIFEGRCVMLDKNADEELKDDSEKTEDELDVNPS
ncbi:MAG: polymer-forming cytoskeletal protein [Candidatus Marinimicrobia bacterium]|nr:polymer-forming cytoskeletal protein [Candidatus Neomarinimicrobiota bacterium]MCH7955530.1 polymer-forming cytoskeletal protein [Candidatus Neomarinimicrobiota bacterium]